MDRAEFDALFSELEAQKVSGANCVIVQKREELWKVVESLQEIGASNLMEVGANFGGTLKFWEKVAQPPAKILSLDLENKLCLDFGDTVHLIYGDSHSEEVAAQVRKFWAGAKIDFLFIDGDHSYEGVKADFENYYPLVREGGIIGFHDIGHAPITQFWDEIEIPCRSKVVYSFGLGTGLMRL